MWRKFLFLAIVLPALFQNVACGEEQPGASKPEAPAPRRSEMLALVPEQTKALFYANFSEMRKTEVGQQLQLHFRDQVREDKDDDYWDFVEATGIEPEKDLYEVWMGSLSEDDDDHDAGGVIATGRFDKERIIEYLKHEHEHDFEKSEYAGYDVFVSKKKRDRSEVAFIDNSTVVAGNGDWVRNVLQHAKDKSSSVLDNEVLASLISEVSPRNHMWGVIDLSSATSEWAKNLKQSPFKGTESIRNMKTLTFYTHMDEKADVHVRGNFTTDEEAELLADAINGFKAMAKLMLADDREAIDLLNEIKISTKGPHLEVSALVDKEFFEKVKEKREKFSNGPVKML